MRGAAAAFVVMGAMLLLGSLIASGSSGSDHTGAWTLFLTGSLFLATGAGLFIADQDS